MATTMASRLVRNMTRRTVTTMATPTENLTQVIAERATTTAPADPSLSFLPLRLRNFFAKYPPQHYSAAVAPASRLNAPADAASNTHNPTSSNISEEFDLSSLSPEDLPTPYTPNRDAKGNKRNPTAWSASKAILYNDPEHPNPFLPQP
ncbi:hypothetical protein F66182_18584, partial [Fusarium sp. NRRL 66182]